jgi:hypothetical protein
MQQPNSSPPNNTQRNAIIIVAVLAAIVLVAILLSSRTSSTENAIATATSQSDGQPITPVLESGDERESFSAEGITLGDFVSGRSLDRDSCILEVDDSFAGDELIYVGLQESLIPQGTVVFVRLYRNNVALEDTDEIEAPEDFQGCLWFEFSATARAVALEAGDYEAEIFVNTRPADSVAFTVR